MFSVKRSSKNPIIENDTSKEFEAFAAFNGSPIREKNITYLLYRAQSLPEKFENTTYSKSIIVKAESKDGFTFSKKQPFIEPEKIWELYGCEDPRVTKLDGKFYIFYTALSHFPFTPEGIRVAVAISNDLKTIKEKHLITPFNAKAMTLFPEKIDGKFTAILSVHTDMPPSKTAIIQFTKEEEMWSEEYWQDWYSNIDSHTIQLKRGQNERIEIGATPLKTKYGWLLIYSHVQNYYSDNKIFGIEAVLLDLKNPRKIIARTNAPFIVPEASYEKEGTVPNIVFPTGALIKDDILHVYYGGADTVCATASLPLEALLKKMVGGKIEAFIRSRTNPILKPTQNFWENKAVLNAAAIENNSKIHLLYRAMGNNNTSVIGYASSADGEVVDDRSKNPVYLPRETFEKKGIANGNSGCEDPRIIQIGQRMYMTYTGFNGIDVPAIALTSISIKDFKNKNWDWTKPILISPKGIDDKDGSLVPFAKNKKNLLIHRINHKIVGSFIDIQNPEPAKEYTTILEPRPGMWDSQKVGISSPLILTKKGFLMIYHGISDDGVYRVGLALLDAKNPLKVLSRTADFIFEPKESYEKEGVVNKVVFPCGAVVRKGIVYMYYGGGDKVLGLATAKLSDLLSILID